MKFFGNKKIVSLILAILAILLLVFGIAKRQLMVGKFDKCYESFHKFVYDVPDKQTRQKQVLPLSPWEIVSPLPKLPEQWDNYDVKATRVIGGYTEIWAMTHVVCLYCYNEPDSGNYRLLVYRTDTQEWETVSAQIGSSKTFVRDLFVTSDGSLWASIIWDEHSDVGQPPILSRFNEQTRSFEPVREVQRIPSAWPDPSATSHNLFLHWSEVVLDSNDVFWIFAQHEGIYSYNAKSRQIKYHAEISDRLVTDAEVAPDGSIYFRKQFKSMMGFALEGEELFHFLPETDEIQVLNTPLEPWPNRASLLVDDSNRLWLGAAGYRNASGSWRLLSPRLAAYSWSLGLDMSWTYSAQPEVFMQSSDGRLWFVIPDSDFSGVKSGIAWLDPRSNKGCWFTSEGNTIVEDAARNLWLIAGGELYRYSISE